MRKQKSAGEAEPGWMGSKDRAEERGESEGSQAARAGEREGGVSKGPRSTGSGERTSSTMRRLKLRMSSFLNIGQLC